MEFLGVGPLELLLILLIALIVLGPDKLPEIARQMGKAMREFNRLSKGMTEEFYRELEAAEEKKATESKASDDGNSAGEDKAAKPEPSGDAEEKQPEEAEEAAPEDTTPDGENQTETEEER